MIFLRNIFVLIILSMMVYSCEKVVYIDVDDDQRYVIVEGVLKDQPGNNYVLLSRSTGLYDYDYFEVISGASVKVSDKDGTVYDFIEDAAEPGKYTHPTFSTLPSNQYDLFININGEIITSTCATYSKPKIDSLTYYAQYFGGGSVPVDTFYMVSYHSVDTPYEVNNYRVRISVNGEEDEGVFYLGNDDFIDGQYYNAPFYGTGVGPQDTVLVELICMDYPVYKYFYQLANNVDQSPFSAAPANPAGNLEGNAVGFFGAYTTDTLSIIMP